MNNGTFAFKAPVNETPLHYAPGSAERELLTKELDRQSSLKVEVPLIIGGKEVRTGRTGKMVMPHDHGHCLGTYHMAGPDEVRMAIEAAAAAHRVWSTMSWVDRVSVMLKAGDMITRKYRYLLNAATMLNQSKNVWQAEIDATCEVSDFLRYNAYYASQIYAEQPFPSAGSVNRTEHRPLEGFVLAVTPFNFTAIGANLNASAVVMGNTTLWKPASCSILSNYYVMKIFQEAGVPDGVINFLPGPGTDVGGTAIADPSFAGLHFTGSTGTFNRLWCKVAANLDHYRNYPRIVGETGGKNFVFAHPSADPEGVAMAIVRGAFEYQGQKCSAASRGYIPRSLWPQIRDRVMACMKEVRMGDVRDFGNFINAVIDEKAFDSITGYINRAGDASEATILAGGGYDKSVGYFVEPTLIETSDPHFLTMREEIFGPVMTVHVYEDEKFEEMLDVCDKTAVYGLTGAIFARDRSALVLASEKLRYTAGNLYYNDKPTGASVGVQPFGGARGSGTDEKVGTMVNLLRWVTPRTIKDNFVPDTDYRYPFMD